MIQVKNKPKVLEDKIYSLDLSPIMNKKIIVLGASGQVGRYLLSILENNNFPVKNLNLIASK
jgi:5,10-methylene-tetrahydrofolate dehydrogenase/methenyl tetrahydrofolate cyclohydrolase